MSPQDLSAPPFDSLLGTEVVSASADRVELALQVADHHKQPYGLVHGGVYASLAETAASFGAALGSPSGGAVGLSNHTDFLTATRGGRLRVVATPLHTGRRIQLWEVRITRDDGRLAAHSKVRLFNVEAEAP